MIQVGDIVRLKGYKRTATVAATLSGIRGGLKLDKPLRGFRYWNVKDLEKVQPFIRSAAKLPICEFNDWVRLQP